MKSASLLLTILVLFFASTSFAQYSDIILSDRTANTLSPLTVGKKTIQVQTGFRRDLSSYEQSSNNELLNSRANDGSLKLRYGLFEKLEIIGLVGVLHSGIINNDTPIMTEPTYGLGARLNLYDGNGAIPAVGVEAVLSEAYGFWDLDMTLALRSNITERITVGANASWRVEERLLYTIKPEFAIKPGLGVFVEGLYRQFNNSILSSERNYDLNEFAAGFGAYCVIGENFVVDGSAGSVFESNEYNYAVLPWYFDIGVSYRFDWRN